MSYFRALIRMWQWLHFFRTTYGLIDDFFFFQAKNGKSAASTATNLSSSQPTVSAGSNYQVRVGDVCQLQPAVPHCSSSLLPMLRRRASEPLTLSHRQRYAQRPGDTHTRYTYGFNQSATCAGFTQEDGDKGRNAPSNLHRSKHKFVFVSQSPSGWNRPKERNVSEQAHIHVGLDNRIVDTQGNTRRRADAHRRKARHARSRTLDDLRDDGAQPCLYVENIRAMSGRMYGDPPTHTNRNTHLQYTHTTVAQADSRFTSQVDSDPAGMRLVNVTV